MDFIRLLYNFMTCIIVIYRLVVDRKYLGTMVFVTMIELPQDVRHRQENTKAYINCQALDTGSLLIAER